MNDLLAVACCVITGIFAAAMFIENTGRPR
jgi:hypothetical protein